ARVRVDRRAKLPVRRVSCNASHTANPKNESYRANSVDECDRWIVSLPRVSPDMPRPVRPIAAGLALLLLTPASVIAGPLRHGESPAELSVDAVSERTVRIALTPLDEKGKPRLVPASTALVEQKPDTKLRVRELAEAQEIEIGKLRV